MRSFVLVLAASILAAACSDGGVTPTSPQSAPPISADVIGATSSGAGCDDWSPCDGWPNYAAADGGIQAARPSSSSIGTGNPGTFFLPELVDNHKPFPGTFLPGISDFLQAVVCEGDRSDPPDLSDCTEPKNDASAFSEGGGFYAAQWKPSKAGDDDRTWRIFVTLAGELVLAHRDVYVGDPSSVNPADGEVLSVRANSNVNIKVAVTSESGIQFGDCSAADDGLPDPPDPEEIICIIPAGTSGSITLLTAGGFGETVVANFNEQFPLLIFADAECDGIDVDIPTYGPCVDMEAPTLTQALEDSSIFFCDADNEPIGAPAGAFVLQQSLAAGTAGTQALPAIDCGDQVASSIQDGFFDLITGGVDRVARLFGAHEAVATSAVGHSGGGGAFNKFGSMFQLAFGATLSQPSLPEIVQQDQEVDVQVPVLGDDGVTVYLFSTQNGGVVGNIVCPASLAQDEDCVDGVGIHDAVKFTTGAASVAKAVWTPGPSGEGLGGTMVELRALGAGIGVEGSDSEDGGNGIEGTLIPFDRDPFGTDGAHNGPIPDAVDAFEPWPHELGDGGKPVALNDLAQISTVLVCGGDAVPVIGDGEWDAAWLCAGDPRLAFEAKLSGKPPAADNAFLYVMEGTEGGQDYVYFGLQISGAKDFADLFINFSQTGTDELAEEYDDLVLVRSDEQADMYTTEGCANSEGKSLCGDLDPVVSALAAEAFSSEGDLFFEIRKPSCSTETEDFCLTTDPDLFGYLTLTGGKGGGKGSTIAEDFRVWTRLLP